MVNYKSEQKSPANKFNRRVREGILILTIAISLFLLAALLSYKSTDPSWSNAADANKIINIGGYFGAWMADILFVIFGYTAYFFPCTLTYVAWSALRRDGIIDIENGKSLSLLRIFGFFIIIISGSGLAALYFKNFTGQGLPDGSGGIFGDLFCNFMTQVANPFGAGLIMIALFLAGITLFSGLSWVRLVDNLGRIILGFLSNKNKTQLENNLDNKLDNKIVFRGAKIEPKLVIEESAAYLRGNNLKPKKTATVNSSIINAIESKPQVKPEKSYNVPIDLLDLNQVSLGTNYTDEQLHIMSQEVELRLRDFGVDARVTSIHPGPVITRFELQLAAGTKVSKITALAKDLARSLSVTSVRIVEIIQGKSVIGLELPNAQREIIKLREILDTKAYKNAHSPLTIALGKDIAGNSVIVDLAKMPHLLVAGTTGSGKSVGLNAILLSLLYKYSPSDVRLLLIDPKMLELSVYDGIPHLLAPVVTNMKEAGNALRWCITEMDRRYRLMASLGVRNIIGYNVKVREAREKGAPLLDPLWQGQQVESGPLELQELPYLVVLADEFADMMMVVGKKVEELITRLAQKARAAGIHLILATQRPSVDVVTGLIKANIPSRISFQVSSKIDSRTILDQMGAEQLLGNGDMLYLPPGTVMPVRVHGAFVSDAEVHRVADYLKQQGQPEYIAEILEEHTVLGIDLPADSATDAEQDTLYDQAVAFVAEVRRVSTSSIQRRFKIGYNRAARIVEAMEKAGLVGKMEANGNRELLISEDGG